MVTFVCRRDRTFIEEYFLGLDMIEMVDNGDGGDGGQKTDVKEAKILQLTRPKMNDLWGINMGYLIRFGTIKSPALTHFLPVAKRKEA